MVSPGRSSVSGGIATPVCRAWYRSAASLLTSASVRVVGGAASLMGSNLEQPPPESTGPFSAIETNRLVAVSADCAGDDLAGLGLDGSQLLRSLERLGVE